MERPQRLLMSGAITCPHHALNDLRIVASEMESRAILRALGDPPRHERHKAPGSNIGKIIGQQTFRIERRASRSLHIECQVCKMLLKFLLSNV